MPKVSIVMPVHNVAPFVEEAVASALGQTLRDIELIVIDDGSTDGTAERVERFDDPRMRLVRKRHGGLVEAGNLGFELAAGEYVARLDGDDMALPELVERQAQELDRHPEAGVVGVWVRRFGGRQYSARMGADPAELRRLMRSRYSVQGPVMYRRSAALRVGGFRSVRWEDWDLAIRIAARYDLRSVPEYLALVRSRRSSLYWSVNRVAKTTGTLHAQLTAARHLGVDARSLAALVRTCALLPVAAALDVVRPRGSLVEAAAAPPTVSVVVATYGRPALARACLAGIAAQEPPADEVLVVHRPEDRDTAALVDEWRAADTQRRRATTVSQAGVVHAYRAGAQAARGDVVAFVDDDAVPRAGWLAEIMRGFLDPTIGAVGGRIVDHAEGEVLERWTARPGRVTWYGRVIGDFNHHTDHYGDVDHLQGVNMAFRREEIHHDARLLHSTGGLAQATELDTCLTLRRQGRRILFTPWAVVDHASASRRDAVLGSRVDGPDVRAASANYTYAILKYLSPIRRPVFLAYALLVGSSMLPGPLRVVAELPASRARAAAMARRIPMAWRGRLLGLAMHRAWRRERGQAPAA